MATDDQTATSRRSPIVFGAVGAVVGAGVAFGISALIWAGGSTAPSSHGAASASTTTTSSTAHKGNAKTAPLTGLGKQLERLLAAGTGVTYHATYSLTSTDPDAGGGSVTVEVWHMPPLERQDSSLDDPGAPAEHVEALQLSSGLVNCTQSGTSAWTCGSVG